MKCDKCGRDKLTAKELSIHIKYFHKVKDSEASVTVNESCPDCGSLLAPMEGCKVCTCCGWSKCGG